MKPQQETIMPTGDLPPLALFVLIADKKAKAKAMLAPMLSKVVVAVAEIYQS
jgi:hypothetical protein